MSTDQSTLRKINELIEKVDTMKKQEVMDLSSDQDLSIAIMNLISIEEHFIFSGAKTGKTKYYDLVEEVREMRKQLLKKIIKDYEGEIWCISKHLLAASMRLMEVGTKQLSMENKEEAYDLFGKAYDLYALFWGIQMKVISTDQLGDIEAPSSAEKPHTPKNIPARVSKEIATKIAPKSSIMARMGDLVRKAVDCCRE